MLVVCRGLVGVRVNRRRVLKLRQGEQRARPGTVWFRDAGVRSEVAAGVIFFYIFNLSRFCKNIWSNTNLAKIYIWRRGLWRQGHNAVGHGARCRPEWALSRNAKGYDVKSLPPWLAALGSYRPASVCRWGNTATHGGMYSLPLWAATVGFLFF
jgi:hypothetical protein